MDQLTLDVTGVPEISAGDEVVFIGYSRGRADCPGKRARESVIMAEEMADASGTITNEILSRLGARLRRTEVRTGRPAGQEDV